MVLLSYQSTYEVRSKVTNDAADDSETNYQDNDNENNDSGLKRFLIYTITITIFNISNIELEM